MSRIYFHSYDGEAELLGSERAYMGHSLTTKIALGLLNVGGYNTPKQLLRFIKPENHLAQLDSKSPMWERGYEASFTTGMTSGLINYRNREIEPFTVALNTALAVGNDVIKLAARLHGQCEIHTWVDGPNRAWLADIMQAGRDTGLYRDEMGWEKVIALLRSGSTLPVVTSYSVCDRFPNRSSILDEDIPTFSVKDEGELDVARDDWWGEYSSSQQWDMCMRWLRVQQGLELQPDDWDSFYFTPGITVFDLLAPDYGKRMSTKLGLIEAAV